MRFDQMTPFERERLYFVISDSGQRNRIETRRQSQSDELWLVGSPEHSQLLAKLLVQVACRSENQRVKTDAEVLAPRVMEALVKFRFFL